MSTGLSAHELRRATREILDDTQLPRYLQVNRILELIEHQLMGIVFEIPEEIPDEVPKPAARAVKKKRAKRKKA